MARAYSNDLRERVVGAVQAGESCRAVAARFGVAATAEHAHHLQGYLLDIRVRTLRFRADRQKTR